jgi:hypothetical protein
MASTAPEQRDTAGTCSSAFRGFPGLCKCFQKLCSSMSTSKTTNPQTSVLGFLNCQVDPVDLSYPCPVIDISAVGPPQAPTNVIAVTGVESATVSFTAATGATSYIVTATSSTGGVSPTIVTGILSSPTVVSGLTPGANYTFTVQAVNSTGTSPSSAASSPSLKPLPAAPTGVSAVAGVENATVTFVGSAGATSYSVTATSSTGGVSPTVVNFISSSPTIINGLTPGADYTFTVKAVNSSGSSPASVASSPAITPTAPAPPLAPTNVSAVAGPANATVSFTTSAGATSYTVTATSSTGGVSPTTVTGRTSSPTVVSGLTPGANYSFTVVAVNSGGSSPASVASSPEVTPLLAEVTFQGTSVSVGPGNSAMLPLQTSSGGTWTVDGNSTITNASIPVGSLWTIAAANFQYMGPPQAPLWALASSTNNYLPAANDYISSPTFTNTPAGSYKMWVKNPALFGGGFTIQSFTVTVTQTS